MSDRESEASGGSESEENVEVKSKEQLRKEKAERKEARRLKREAKQKKAEEKEKKRIEKEKSTKKDGGKKKKKKEESEKEEEEEEEEKEDAMEVDEKEEEENEDAEDKKPQTSFLSIGGRPSIIPKGFKDVKLQKTTNYFDTILKDPKKQLWLIKLPHEVDIDQFDQKEITLDLSSKNKIGQVSLGDHDYDMTQLPVEECQQYVTVLPSKEKNAFVAGKPFQRYLSLSESVKFSGKVEPPRVEKLKHEVDVSQLRLRWTPLGIKAPTAQPLPDFKTKEGEKKKKKKEEKTPKKKRGEKEEEKTPKKKEKKEKEKKEKKREEEEETPKKKEKTPKKRKEREEEETPKKEKKSKK
ncbi:hypothetical protein PROFUN_09261 [Planoprotostelium fungivorum]|uniref:Uncharacterized protein n=1 Tax=Planoprotostelium fungivorum TaxID=1890364 RepID=A0A2P6NKX2_9EUKA|nr:hypothetical protein PROFUN_09261 [Planoprotostelium fungivorum]